MLAGGKLNRKKVYSYNGKNVYQCWATIPKEIVEQSGIKPETKLVFHATKGEIIISPDTGEDE